MRYVLGIDGGGSKTACLVASEHGELLGYGRAGPVNTNYVPRQEAVQTLQRAIRCALENAGLRAQPVEAVCLSAPVSPPALEEAISTFRVGRVKRAAEGETPRWAARFWMAEHIGVAVGAGTGSMARGWSRDGREAGAGGWGATLGDEGSGHWISMQAMTAVLQAYDGRIEPTRLTQAVLSHFGMSHVLDIVFQASQGLVRSAGPDPLGIAPDSGSTGLEPGRSAQAGVFFHSHSRQETLTRYEVASLCPVVVEMARLGDWKALQILREAGVELGRLVSAVIRRLGMQDDEFVVLPFGGVFQAGDLVLDSLRATMLEAAPRARLVRPRFEPVVGAALLALDEVGVHAGHQIIETVERSAIGFPDVLETS
jgi:N-acetylglucosamine kinase-like BadF-type ATPase